MSKRMVFVMFVVLLVAGSIAAAFAVDYEMYVISGANTYIWRYDAQTGASMPSPGNFGAVFADGPIWEPNEIGMGPDNNIYVCNGKRDPYLDHYWGDVKRFDRSTGAYIDRFIDGPSDFTREIIGMKFRDGYCWVSWRWWLSHPSGPGAIVRYDSVAGDPFGDVGPLDVFFTAPDFTEPFRFDFFSNGDTVVAKTGSPDGLWVIDSSGNFKQYLPTNYPYDVITNGNYAYGVHPWGSTQVSRYVYANGTLTQDSSWVLGYTFSSIGKPAILGNMMYIPDISNNSIKRFNLDTGALIDTIVPSGRGGLSSPTSMLIVYTGTGSTVSGTVTPKDWAGAVSGMAATIELRDALGSTVETKNVTLGSGGSFSFSTALTGSYTAVAKSGHWLAKAMPLTISGGSGSVSFELTNGDCNGDNGVDEIDYALLSNAWYQALGDPAYNPVADLNGDGGVDEIDYAILSNAWYTAGD